MHRARCVLPPRQARVVANTPGTVAALVAAYASSARFKHEIAPETRRTQWAILQRFRDEHGEKRVATLRREHVVAVLSSKKPYPRRNWLKAVRPMMQFAVSIGMIAVDPTRDIKANVKTKGEGFRPWGEEEIAAFRQHHAIGSRARLAACRGDHVRISRAGHPVGEALSNQVLDASVHRVADLAAESA